MARVHYNIMLGFLDESVTEKHRDLLNFTTNKVGGKPDWPPNMKIECPVCELCQLPKLFILQIYVPLDNYSFHRTLYLFACINPNCWTQSSSWTCFRIQGQVTETPDTLPVAYDSNPGIIDWCKDAEDWGDIAENANEENGNLINNLVQVSDDESCSTEESLRAGLVNLTVDDQNANTDLLAEAQGGAVGTMLSPAATAEIEGDEGEVITIDTPTAPQHDVVALLQETTPLPQDLFHKQQSNLSNSSILQFKEAFICVREENGYSISDISDHHVKELLQEYQQNCDEDLNLLSDSRGTCSGDGTTEKYEKSGPPHGDKMFHYFLSKIQKNPGQILRYSREGSLPLLLYPLHEVPRICNYCQGDMVFEFQVLPTLISKLRLTSDIKDCPRLEFGTVLVFTCKRSCWSKDADIRNEVVIVQNEMY